MFMFDAYIEIEALHLFGTCLLFPVLNLWLQICIYRFVALIIDDTVLQFK